MKAKGIKELLLVSMFFDLTMDIDERTPVFSGDRKQEIKQAATIKKQGWNEKRLSMSSHFGTHIDAPFHMLENGKKLSDFRIEKFIGEAIVLPMKNGEAEVKAVKNNDIVFLFTGHTDKAYDKDFMQNNPVIKPDLAQKLIDKKVKIVGLDSYTPDNEPYEVHKMFFRKNIMIVENLVGLKPLVGKRFQCYILPLKIKDGDGAPCRVLAVL